MSITKKDLEKLKERLKTVDIVKIANQLDCSKQWVNKVLSNVELATKHIHIVEKAIFILDEDKKRIAEVAENLKKALA